ncbi:hypothetical protein J4439_08090 [Candidatus Woesearchaeota archaeon]|nr:hypothetical protein [Candidatus Woesearchaeota archaeon]
MVTEFGRFYEGLRKKHKLPTLDKLDEAFEVSIIEDQKFFLREVVRKMSDHLDFHIKLLEEVLQPDTNLGQMREANAFSELRKKEIYSLYKQLRYYYRLAHQALLEGSDRACAEFINTLLARDATLRKELIAVVKQLRHVWEKELVVHNDLAYLG